MGFRIRVGLWDGWRVFEGFLKILSSGSVDVCWGMEFRIGD